MLRHCRWRSKSLNITSNVGCCGANPRGYEEVFYRHVLQYLGVRVFLIRLAELYSGIYYCGILQLVRWRYANATPSLANQGAKIYGNSVLVAARNLVQFSCMWVMVILFKYYSVIPWVGGLLQIINSCRATCSFSTAFIASTAATFPFDAAIYTYFQLTDCRLLCK